MLVTNQLFDAFIRCRCKAHLLAGGATGIVSEYERLLHDLNNDCRARSLLSLRRQLVSDQMTDVPLSLPQVVAKAYRLAENVTATAGRFSALIDAVERVSDDGAPRQVQYVPLLFVHREKLNRLDKLRIAFQSLVMAEVLETPPTFGKIIHGRTGIVTKLNFVTSTGSTQIKPNARRLMKELAAQMDGKPPVMTLNDHCTVCQFRE